MIMIGNFEAAHKMLNGPHINSCSFRTKLDYFFVDHEFLPLLVQENYLNTFSDKDISLVSQAADFISLSEKVFR